MLRIPLVALALVAAPLVASTGPPEATSLLGKPLARPELPEEFRQQQEGLLAEAQARLAATPDDLDAMIWVGRRTAYLGRYGDAIRLYTNALGKQPYEPRLLRHRGHRWLTVRELDKAVADLSRAGELVRGNEDKIEQDGLPNARGIPTSTLQSNIWYHLGLAHYLKGDFESALGAYRECLGVSKNPDMLAATTYWLYLTLGRLGKHEEATQALAPIEAEMDIIENHDYHRMLWSFKEHQGAHELWEDAGSDTSTVRYATVAFGFGAYHLVGGRIDKARTWFERALQSSNWAAFGYLAAEAELARE